MTETIAGQYIDGTFANRLCEPIRCVSIEKVEKLWDCFSSLCFAYSCLIIREPIYGTC
jgi:hypothetical protein